jgi:hypothetical protein
MKGLSGRIAPLFFTLLLVSFCVFATLLSSNVSSSNEATLFVAEGSLAQQALQTPYAGQQLSLPDQATPRAAFPDGGSATADWRGGGVWSFCNSLLGIIGLTEGLFVVVRFFFRCRSAAPNLFTQGFMLRLLALFIAFVFLIATSITSDFAGSVIVFDKMSLPLIVLFIAQQIVLFGIRAKDPDVLMDAEERKRFRARMRYGDRRSGRA